MKICFCIQDMALGGSSTVVFDIVKNWPEKNDSLYLISFFDNFDERYNSLFNLPQLKIFKLHKRKTIDLKFNKVLKKTIKSISPNYISSHLTCVFYLKILGLTKKYSTFHTIHSLPNYDLPFLYRVFLKNDFKKGKIKLIGCCDYIAKKASLLYKTGCAVITNGTQISCEQNIKKQNSKVRFLFVGRLIDVKNVPLLIKAFSLMERLDSELTLCGYGPNESEILEIIRNSSRKNDIYFLGKINSIDEIYKKNDVLCLTSTREGLPITILEGIKFNLAIVATDVCGNYQFVFNEKNGFLLKTFDEYDIAKKLDLLCANRDMLLSFQEYQNRIKKDISSKIMAEKYYDVLIKKLDI